MSTNDAVEYLEQFLGNDDGELSWQVCEAIGEVLERLRAAEADAGRYRWLCDGHGYFMEENMLCHMSNDKAEADAAIDQAMKEQSK